MEDYFPRRRSGFESIRGSDRRSNHNMGPGNCIITGPTTMKELDCSENVSQTGETLLNPKRGIGTSLWQVHDDSRQNGHYEQKLSEIMRPKRKIDAEIDCNDGYEIPSS